MVFGIVARGHDNAAIELRMAGRKVDFFGSAQPDIVDVDALRDETFSQRRFNRRAAQADIVTECHCFGANNLRVGTADAPRDRFIELIRDPAANVVGFETAQGLHTPQGSCR